METHQAVVTATKHFREAKELRDVKMMATVWRQEIIPALDAFDKRRFCCQIGCDRDADYEIVTVRSTVHGPINAGPDPYADYVDACLTHVGNLLGYQLDVTCPDEVFWQVFSLPNSDTAEGLIQAEFVRTVSNGI
jgi:hypothetical protein